MEVLDRIFTDGLKAPAHLSGLLNQKLFDHCVLVSREILFVYDEVFDICLIFNFMHRERDKIH